MTDKEKLEKIKSLADKMYYAAFNMTTDASLLRKAMDNYHQFIINEYHKEEPVSKELEEAATKSANKATPYTRVDVGNGEVYVYTKHIVIDRFKAGANWEIAQMMKDAIIATIESDLDPHGADYGNQKIICGWGELEAKKFKNGSKVKLIIIKED